MQLLPDPSWKQGWATVSILLHWSAGSKNLECGRDIPVRDQLDPWIEGFEEPVVVEIVIFRCEVTQGVPTQPSLKSSRWNPRVSPELSELITRQIGSRDAMLRHKLFTAKFVSVRDSNATLSNVRRLAVTSSDVSWPSWIVK